MKRTLGLALAAGACVALGSAPARAADATGCMPPVIGIPWSGAAPDVTALDDLKWNGAFAYGWASGTLQDGEFRNLLATDASGNRTLYVYYKSYVHRAAINYLDGFQFGVSFDTKDSSGNKTATTGFIVNASFGADNTSGPNGDGTWTGPTVDAGGKPTWTSPGSINFGKQYTTYSSTGTVTGSTTSDLVVPTWLSPTTAGSHPPVYFWILKDPVSTDLYFVVQAQIPISTSDQTGASGLYVDANQFLTPALGVPFWGDELTMEPDPIKGMIQVPRPWPNVSYTSQGRVDGDKYQAPSPDHWGLLQPSAPTPAGACTGGGLRFGPSDILNNGGYTINLWAKDSSGTPQRGQNSPSVNITNVGPAIDITGIQATFNIAPMGSQDIHSLAWQPLNNANNAFKCASGTKGDYATCVPQPVAGTPLTTTSVGGSSAFTVGTASPWVPDWSYTCAVIADNGTLYDQDPAISSICNAQGQFLPSAADAQPNPDHVLHEHQCMLVQLSSTKAGVQFDTQAQFQNMHVAAHASHFEEKARIDISGAPKIKGASGHWVYIVVETRNMLHDIPNGMQSPFTQDKLDSLLYGCGEDCGNNLGNLPAFDYVASQFATTVMHVYRDTGLHKRIGHKKVAVYEPQSSYGYFVSHDGMLYGWDVAIKGAKKVAPNVYKLWIKDGGAVDVTTSIDALDQPRCSGGGDDGGDDDHKKKG